MHASGGAATQIRSAFAEAGITELPAVAYDQFETYLDLLLRWNLRMNLTAVREPEAIIRRHFVECAFAAQHLPRDITTLLDYGSGAGLPGIPSRSVGRKFKSLWPKPKVKRSPFCRRRCGFSALRENSMTAAWKQCRTAGLRRCHDASSREDGLAMPVAIQHMKQYLVLFTTEESAGAF